MPGELQSSGRSDSRGRNQPTTREMNHIGCCGPTLWVVHRHRRIDDNHAHRMRSRVFNYDLQRKPADVRYRDGALGTPSGDIAWTLGIESAAVHLRSGRAGRKEWAQRYYSQADSDDGQYEFGIAVRRHFRFPRI